MTTIYAILSPKNKDVNLDWGGDRVGVGGIPPCTKQTIIHLEWQQCMLFRTLRTRLSIQIEYFSVPIKWGAPFINFTKKCPLTNTILIGCHPNFQLKNKKVFFFFYRLQPHIQEYQNQAINVLFRIIIAPIVAIDHIQFLI